jgi:hypothetical protein
MDEVGMSATSLENWIESERFIIPAQFIFCRW